jgi:hypothetical protein
VSTALTGTQTGSVGTSYSSLEPVELPGLGTLALITMTGKDRKPAMFSPESLNELGALLRNVARGCPIVALIFQICPIRS